MNVAIGTGGVVLGLVASVLGVVTLALGLATNRPALLRSGRQYVLFVVVGALLCVFAMEHALITRDFSVKFVHDNGSSRTPFIYNIATMWGALQGSIILWATILAGYTAAIAFTFRKKVNDPMVSWALLTMLTVSAFFFLLMLTVARPFISVTVPAGYDGPGPNPLLQNNPLMAFHPPMLYLGYVGFTVPFAFAIAALVTGRVGEGWLMQTRRWTLFAWGFLSVGIVLGAWWSYEVLGWGGYWMWDPVENASFLPWLTGTAFLHSVMVQERRGMLRVWNLSLVCATFSLTILGTFLTRSGVLDSVHAFTESPIGPAILTFFGLVVVVTIGLIGWRGDRLRSPGRIDSPLSREGAFLANNVLFAAFAFVVLLGTVFPLIVEALNGNEISVGEPYFNRMTMPIGLSLLFLMAVAPALPWRKASAETMRGRLHWPAWGGTLAVVLAVVLGAHGLAPLVAFGLGGFAAGAAVRQLVLASRRQGWRGVLGRTNGGMVVHLGVVLIAIAFAASSSYKETREVTLKPGATATIASHRVTYLSSSTKIEKQKTIVSTRLRVDGGHVYSPSLATFPGGSQAIGTPSIRTGLTQDVYLALLSAPDGSGSITVRIIVQPLVLWLWVGGGVIAIGTVLAAFPGRRRIPTDPASAPSRIGRPHDDEPPPPAREREPIEVGV